ncbi:6025_t:CDS:2 [Entrophospora sp. SA101]|nr:6025_t:CDS:2 [Entrophospora sp. SA101]
MSFDCIWIQNNEMPTEEEILNSIKEEDVIISSTTNPNFTINEAIKVS